MLKTIQHGDKDKLVVVAKLLTGYVKVHEKVEDADSFIKLHQSFDADFVAHVVAWQGNHGLKADGIIGKDTWTSIAENAPTCSPSKNRTSGYTMAVQMLVDGNLTCDAIYGSRTKAAVAAFKEACALKADGICGPKTWKALVGVKEDQEKGKHINPCVHYLQWDKRWKNIMYSNHGDKKQTIGNSGCGPSAVAQVVATWIDPAITPVEMCKLALDNGYRTKNSGTKGDFCIFVADKYPQIEKCTRTGSVKTVKSALKQGALAVCCMNSNDHHFWTTGGHYITAIGYDDKNYIYANDPNKEKAPRKQLQDKFQSCLKQAWIMWPAKKEETHDPFDGVNDSADGTPKRGDAIVDISKYQPTVNYDKFIKATELIILRAGYRGTGGGIREDQKFQLHADELTKRGVRFGVYFYSIANTKEQAREEARMFWKYANGYKPLFWAMDAEKDSITKDAIVAFVEELRKQGAEKVGCYVANHLYQKYDYASIKDRMDFTWIPRYSNTPPVYECDMWQFTPTGRVDGISGNVDLNRITGQGHDLAWFTGGNGA